MDVLAEEVERKIILKKEHMEQTLGNLYRIVAEAAGYAEAEDTMYDCTKILIAPDVQEAVIRAYQALSSELPLVTIIMLLAVSGPKVDHALGAGEVVIQSGFIGKRGGAAG